MDQPFQMLVSSIDYNEFVGRIAVGRIERGVIHQNDEIVVCNYHDPEQVSKKLKAVSLYEFDGLNRVPVTEATAGNIIAMSGIGNITIGDTHLCALQCGAAGFGKDLQAHHGNDFYHQRFSLCRQGRQVCDLRQIRERLEKELLKDVSLRVTEAEGSTDAFYVAGRGEMHLSILIETMRREGYEFRCLLPVCSIRRSTALSASPWSVWSVTCPLTA